MIERVATWQRRHLVQLWLGAIALSVCLFLFRPSADSFWLLPYPTWNPASWVRIIVTIMQFDPLLAIALLILPATLAFTGAVLWARRART